MKSFKTNRIIFAAGALVLGIILLIWPSTSLLIVAKCIGAFLAAGGVAAGWFYFRDHDSALKSVLLIMAAVMLICGIVIFIHPEELVKLIPTIIGVLVVLSGLLNLGETFVLNRQKYGRWWISLIVSIITIAAGLFVVSRAFSLASLITRIAGGVLVFDGLSDFWVISRMSASEGNIKESAEKTAAGASEAKPEAGPSAEQGEKPADGQGAASAAAPAAEQGAKLAGGQEAAPAAAPAAAERKTDAASSKEQNDVPEYYTQPEQNTEYHAPAAFAPGEQDPGTKE